MPRSPATEFCPFCGAKVSPRDECCPSCGEEMYEEASPRPRRNLRRRNQVEATDFLVPTNVSAWSIASCYMGFVGLCLPLLGLVFAVPGVICGIIALRQWRASNSYGSVTSNVRTIIGLVLGSLAILLWGGLLLAMLLSPRER